MEKLNIAEILKDCPKGMELNCTMFDNVTFMRVDSSRTQFPIEIAVSGLRSKYLTKEGCFHDSTLLPEAKCVIFPKGKTTWEGFQRPFKDGDIVAFDNPHRDNLQVFIFKNKKENNTLSSCYLMLDDNELDLEEGMYYVTRHATEEEKQKLFDAIKANGYKWNAETKTLEKLIVPKFKVGDRVKHISAYKSGIVVKVNDKGYCIDYPTGEGVCSVSFTLEKDYELLPNKFDITTLKPFEGRVLVRSSNDDIWKPAIWGIYNDIYCSAYPYITTYGATRQCIPYEDNQHLLGTTNDCDNYFKTWE